MNKYVVARQRRATADARLSVAHSHMDNHNAIDHSHSASRSLI